VGGAVCDAPGQCGSVLQFVISQIIWLMSKDILHVKCDESKVLSLFSISLLITDNRPCRKSTRKGA